MTKPYNFTANSVISASQMNSNFDTLYTVVSGNIDSSNLKNDSGSLFRVTGGLMAAMGSNVGIGTIYAQSAVSNSETEKHRFGNHQHRGDNR